MEEIWKDIPTFEGYYQASTFGRIRSISRKYIGAKGILTYMPSKILGYKSKKYIYVHLAINGKKNVCLAHRLVAKTFIANLDNKPQVNHINGIKQDNRVENLEWCTSEENNTHASLNGLRPKGEKNGSHKLTEKLVKEIRGKYIPYKYPNIRLAKEYGISYHEIQLINQRKRWAHFY